MIKIYTTGGTIGGLEYENAEDESGQQAIDISKFLETANITLEYKVVNLFDKDSRHITSADRQLLADNIIQSKETKILITHGTYTMAETARYLGKLNLKKTIVLVGAFILGSMYNTDAPFNIGYAIASLQHLDYGVYIVMNGKVFSWDNVIKNNDNNRFERENE